MDSKSRAQTDAEKREVVERIYRAWCAKPYLRLGQLIFNATSRGSNENYHNTIYNIEDNNLALSLARYFPNIAISLTHQTPTKRSSDHD